MAKEMTQPIPNNFLFVILGSIHVETHLLRALFL